MTSVISGATNDRQVLENAAAADWEFAPELRAALDEVVTSGTAGG